MAYSAADVPGCVYDYLEGDAHVAAEVSEWLCAAEQNREAFVRLAAAESVMTEALADASQLVAGQESAVSQHRPWFARSRFVAAAAVVIVGMIVALSFTGVWPGGTQASSALIVDARGLGSAYSPGSRIDGASTLDVPEGTLQFRTEVGALVTVTGPAEFSVEGPNRVGVQSGSLYANVGPSAVGFTVDVPSGRIVDLGTAFAVDVTDAGTSVMVDEGSVRLEAAGAVPLVLGEGDAGRVSATGIARGLDDRQAFSIPRDMPRPRAVDAAVSLRPSYLHRFGVDRPTSNAISPGEYPARLGRGRVIAEGPVLEAGATNAALGLLQRDGTAPEIIAGMTPAIGEAYTLAFWFRVDQVEAQAIVSGASNPGPDQSCNLVVRLDDAGAVVAELGIRAIRPDEPSTNNLGEILGERHKVPAEMLALRSAERIEAGRWYHVAITAESGAGGVLYINGEPVDRVALDATGSGRLEVRQERLLLGTHPTTATQGEGSPPMRGAVDEIAMYSRALWPDQVRSLAEAAYRDSSVSTPSDFTPSDSRPRERGN
ncbi:MAG: LamG-like jellyroll fold domain-containing protein [Planctomycetota bacterium]